MLKNGQTYFKNVVVTTLQDVISMSDHFSTLCMKGLSSVGIKVPNKNDNHNNYTES